MTDVKQFSSLTWLDLQNNRLNALPPELGDLSKLKELLIAGNPMEALPPEKLRHVPRCPSSDTVCFVNLQMPIGCREQGVCYSS
jgi:Leucine-rich repeat (LRR) protein